MAKRTRSRSRQPKPVTAPTVETDATLLDLDQLAAVWPRLQQAVARDSAGPSAAKGRSGNHGGEGSAALIDVNTQDALVAIATGVDKRVEQLERLLNLDANWRPSAQRIDRIAAELDGARLAPARVRQQLDPVKARMFQLVPYLRWEELDGHARAALAEMRLDYDVRRRALADAISNVQVLDGRLARARADLPRLWTSEAIAALPDWYVQLRDRKQPLAKQITKDVASWLRTGRRALNLQTSEERLGRLCPHHRERPTELRKVPDFAELSTDVLNGRQQRDGEAPLKWRRSSAVRCPLCQTQWATLEEQRVLMAMIEESDQADAEVATIDRILATPPWTLAHNLLAIRRSQLRPYDGYRQRVVLGAGQSAADVGELTGGEA